MADELHMTGALYYKDSTGVEVSLSVQDDIEDVATKETVRLQQSIGIVEEAILLGDVAPTGALLMLVNRDTTNYIEIKSGTGGTIIAKLTPSRKFCIIPLGSGVSAPYAIAHTAACVMDILLISL